MSSRVVGEVVQDLIFRPPAGQVLEYVIDCYLRVEPSPAKGRAVATRFSE
jgi:hypothetical protein